MRPSNLIEIENAPDDIFDSGVKITYRSHNRSGLERVDVMNCGCKVVSNYAHNSNLKDTSHYEGCPICNGWKAQMHGSSYIFACDEHANENRSK
jgi:hypothetical protein